MRLVRPALTSAVAVLGAAVLSVGLAGPALAAPSDQDATWLNEAHRSNLAEIAAGTAAQAEATDETVRELGATFVEHHTALDADVTALAEQYGVELDAEPTAEQQAQLAAVEAEDGAAFDAAWVAQQIGSHRATLAAGETELAEGSDEQVLALARSSAPVVQGHLDALLAEAEDQGVPTGVPAGSGGTVDGGTSGLALAGAGGLLLLLGGTALVRGRRRA